MKGVIFSYVLAYGGAVLSLINPHYGLLAYVALAILKPEAMWFWQFSDNQNFSRLVAYALLAGWAVHGFGNWKLGKGWAITLALVGFLLWAVVSAVQSPDPALGWGFVDPLLKIVIPFVVGMTVLDSVAKLKQLAWVIVLSQGYVAYELNLSYFNNPALSRVQDNFAGLDNNSIAIAMVSCVGLAFFLALHAPAWWQKLVAFAAAGLMSHVIMFSYSRGGMLALLLTGLVIGLLILLIPKKKPTHLVALIGAGLLGARLAGPRVLERFFTTFSDQAERDASAQSRLDLWADCWDSMLKRPVFGLGPDHWPLIAHEYGWPPGKEAHSLWMQTGAEMGFPGLVLLLAFYGLGLVRLWPLARERVPTADPWISCLARAVIASLVGFMIAAQFVSLERLEVPYYVALLGAGILKVHGLGRAAVEPAAAPIPSHA